MTITQTVEIPADRRVLFEFLAPKEIPAGPAQVELKVTPVMKKHNKPMPKNANERGTPHTDALLRIFSKIGDINIDEIRDERLARHLK